MSFYIVLTLFLDLDMLPILSDMFILKVCSCVLNKVKNRHQRYLLKVTEGQTQSLPPAVRSVSIEADCGVCAGLVSAGRSARLYERGE